MLLGILALLVFGPEGLPGVIKTVMRTVRSLRTAANDIKSEVRTALDDELINPNQPQRVRKAPARLIEAPSGTGQEDDEPQAKEQESKPKTSIPESETSEDVALDKESSPKPSPVENSTDPSLEKGESQQSESSNSSEPEVSHSSDLSEPSSPNQEAPKVDPVEELDPDDGPGLPMSPRRRTEIT